MSNDHRVWLPFWGIAAQVPNRGSIGAAHTVNHFEGVTRAAKDLAKQAFDLAAARPLDRKHEAVLPMLAPPALTRAAAGQLRSAEVLDDDDRGEQSLEQRVALLKELHAPGSTTANRHVRHLVEQVVGDAMSRLREALVHAFDDNPHAAAGVIQDVQTRLAETSWPSASGGELKKLQRIAARLIELPRLSDRLVPETLERVLQDLRQAGWEAADRALEQTVQSLVAAEWERRFPELQAFLHDIHQRCIRFGQRQRQFVERLEEYERCLREEQQQRASSVAMPLPGPSSDEVISGMKTASGCTDTPALVSKLCGEFDLRLRELARSVHTHLDAERASFAALLLDLPVEDSAAAWLRLLDEHLGQGHSLYARVAATDPEAVAEFLWRRAAPTCFFLGRDDERFGITITEVAIVRLPPTVSPEDQPVRERLTALFRSYSRNCHITEGAMGEHEISVCRINCGFVIGIEAANHSLIQHYAEAAEHGHLPHLVGIVSDSPLGAASPAYLNLLDDAGCVAGAEVLLTPVNEES